MGLIEIVEQYRKRIKRLENMPVADAMPNTAGVLACIEQYEESAQRVQALIDQGPLPTGQDFSGLEGRSRGNAGAAFASKVSKTARASGAAAE